MPKGILSRFIVATHTFIEDQTLVWRTGVILHQGNTRAEIIEHYHQRQIHIRLVGDDKRDFLAAINHEFRKIHHTYRGLKYDELIPCNCYKCKNNAQPHFYSFNTLKKYQAKSIKQIRCDQTLIMVNVNQLIDDVFVPALPALPNLAQIVIRNFNENELRTLYDDLALDPDELNGNSPNERKRDFVKRMLQNGRKSDLITAIKQARPHLADKL